MRFYLVEHFAQGYSIRSSVRRPKRYWFIISPIATSTAILVATPSGPRKSGS
jgi:hypothetical protein